MLKEDLGLSVLVTVFAMCSDLRCMIYYSKFKPSERSEGVGTRFMATGFFPEFTDEEKDRPYLGTPFRLESGDEFNPTKPFVDEFADKKLPT